MLPPLYQMIGPEQKYGPFPGFVKRKEEKSPSFFPGAGIHWTGEGAKGREGDGPCRSCGIWRGAGPSLCGRRGPGSIWRRRGRTTAGGCTRPGSGGGRGALRAHLPISRGGGAGERLGPGAPPGAAVPGPPGEGEPAGPLRLLRAVKESLRGRSGFCGRRDGALCLLSAPFRPDRPFPIPVLFCLARVERRGGRPWLVWAFDLEGTPVLPRIEPPEGGHTEGAD